MSIPRNSLPRTAPAGLLLAIVLAATGGCIGQRPNPATKSLTDLVSEASSSRNLIIRYRELLSLVGTLSIPDVRTTVYYPGLMVRNNPAFSLGIALSSSDSSFRLTGTSTQVSADDVQAVRDAILEVQQASLAVVNATTVLASARAASQMAEDAGGDKAPADGSATSQPASGDDGKPKHVTLLESAIREQEEAQFKLQQATATFNKSLKPGIVVIRWTRKRDSTNDLDLGDVLGANQSASNTQAGYLVLGHLRLSTLYFGEDFKLLVQTMDTEGDFKLFKKLLVTTHLIQAKHVAYASSDQFDQSIRLVLNLQTSDATSLDSLLTTVDRIDLVSAITTATRLDNAGNIGTLNWSVESKPFVTVCPGRLDVLSLIDDQHPAYSRYAGKKGQFVAQKIRVEPMFSGPQGEAHGERCGESASTQPLDRVDEPTQIEKDSAWNTIYSVSAQTPWLYRQVRRMQDSKQVIGVSGRYFVVAPMEPKASVEARSQAEAEARRVAAGKLEAIGGGSL